MGPSSDISSARGVKRKRSALDLQAASSHPNGKSRRSPGRPNDSYAGSDGDESDLIPHTKPQKRNFAHVIFGEWQINTQYYSPYPVGVDERDPSHKPVKSLTNGRHLHADTAGTTSSKDSQPTNGGDDTPQEANKKLWVCDKCFKYMMDGNAWELHCRSCTMNHPPGRKVYQRGAHTIWEVDGANSKLYCQNLSLFGKFFIDVKTLFFDCEHFLFYVLTDASPSRDHVLAFFSKEKVSADDYNLACIMTFPPYQKKGYGMLLIEFSYELTRRAGRTGTPERPLSVLGMKSYLLYWISTLVRFFRNVLGLPQPVRPGEEMKSEEANALRRAHKVKGWTGENGGLDSPVVQLAEDDESSFGAFRKTYRVTDAITGEEQSHLLVKCTFADIASATGLRPEDASFAMRECGFLQYKTASKRQKGKMNATDRIEVPDETIVVTAELVEKVAKERGVKVTMMERKYVKL